MRVKILTLVSMILFLSTTNSFSESAYPGFNTSAYQHKMTSTIDNVPGIYLMPHDFFQDRAGVPGWENVKIGEHRPSVIESLVIKGSRVIGQKVVIPAGGIYYDATPEAQSVMEGERGVFLGHTLTLVKKTVQEESFVHYQVKLGYNFHVGNHIFQYLFNTKTGIPALLWRTYDGVSIRPQAFTQYKEHSQAVIPQTRIHGVYSDSKFPFAKYEIFSGPWISEELWETSNGQILRIKANDPVGDHSRVLPISCPIGHHIGLMVYNTEPITLDLGKKTAVFKGYLRLKIVKITPDGHVIFTVNGRRETGYKGIDSLYGHGRAIDGIINTAKINFAIIKHQERKGK